MTPSDGLKRVLGTLSALQRLDPANAPEYAASAHTIAASQVQQWEQDLGIALPSDAVVLAALRIPLVERALGTIGGPVAPHDALDDEEWCLVWAGDPWALTETSRDPTYQQMLDLSIAVRRETPMPADPQVLALITDESDGRKMLLSEFLLARIEEYFLPRIDEDRARQDLDRLEKLWHDARANPASDADIAHDFAASVTPDEKSSPTERVRVHHPKFGAGTVIGSSEGSVEVLFDSGDKKRLKPQYLQPEKPS